MTTTDGLTVPLVTGEWATYRNLDHAASAPGLATVHRALERVAPLISSIHRGSGYLSTESTRLYEEARLLVGQFVNAPAGSCVVLTAGTTSAMNILSHALAGERVVVCAWEHHANLLPWQKRCDVTVLPVPGTPGELFGSLATHLARRPGGYVSVTGANNVTGELPDLPALSELARLHDAELIVDAAQLAPHREINMVRDGVAALAFSGHKIGATSAGLGALIVPREWMTKHPPLMAGGGAVDYVHADGVSWSEDPTARHEAGSPNVAGAVALGVACSTLTNMDSRALSETALLDMAHQGLSQVPGITIHQLWPGADRVPVLTFTINGLPYGLVAAVLAAEYGIGVRAGCFCAHQLVAHLLGIPSGKARTLYTDAQAGRVRLPGMVRVSLGSGTTVDTLTALFDALHRIVERGPGWDYQHTDDQAYWWPVGDPRPPLVTFDELGGLLRLVGAGLVGQ